METQQHRSQCPLSIVLDLFGDKWSLLILRDCILLNKRRYSEFLTSPESISTNILASRLKQLESYGILEKFPDPDDGKAALYIPTERGVNLLPVLVEAMRWGVSEFEQSSVPDFVAKLITNGTAKYINKKNIELAEERKAVA